MKEPNSEEMLSAYIDGELSAQERAAIEHWLEESPDARRKLDDFRRLSAVFAGLPRTEVPQEFPVKVLQLAERRMLLPEVAAGAPRRTFHRWTMAIGVSAAAAGLLVILQLNFRPPELPPIEFANGANENTATPHVADEIARAAPADSLGKEGQMVAQSERSKSPEIEAAKRDTAGAPTPPPVAARKGVDTVQSEVATPSAAAGQSRSIAEGKSNGVDAKTSNKGAAHSANALSQDADAANPQLAGISLAINAVRDSGPENELVSVVKVFVVDRADGMKLVQNYFSENGVILSENKATEGGDNQAPGRGSRDGANRRNDVNSKDANGREALYIEAEPSQVVAAFKRMLDAENTGMRVVVGDPIEIAALDPASQNQLKRSKLGSPAPARAFSMNAAKSAAAPAVGGAGLAGGKQSADAVPPTEKATADKKPGGLAAADREAHKANSEKTGVSEVSPVIKKKAAAPPATKPEDQPAEGAAKMMQGSVAKKETSPPPNQRGRQLVMPVPAAIEESAKFGASNAPTDEKGEGAIAKSARRAAQIAPPSQKDAEKAPRENEQEEQAKPETAVVRVLILFELEATKPVPPPAGKGPSGGA